MITNTQTGEWFVRATRGFSFEVKGRVLILFYSHVLSDFCAITFQAEDTRLPSP